MLRFAADNSQFIILIEFIICSQFNKSQVSLNAVTAFSEQVCRHTYYENGNCLFSIDLSDKNSFSRVLSEMGKNLVKLIANTRIEVALDDDQIEDDDALDLDDPQWNCRTNVFNILYFHRVILVRLYVMAILLIYLLHQYIFYLYLFIL